MVSGTTIHEAKKAETLGLTVNLLATSLPISNWWLNLDSSSKVHFKLALSSPFPGLKPSLGLMQVSSLDLSSVLM